MNTLNTKRPDYHVEYASHWYSVPHELVGQRLSLKAGQVVVQIWHKGQCVAQHPRSSHEYRHTTNPLHMPAQHRGHGTWTPERLIEMGCSIGPFTGRVVDAMLKANAHPELAYRAVLGLTALQKKYGKERLEKSQLRRLALQRAGQTLHRQPAATPAGEPGTAAVRSGGTALSGIT